MGFCKEVGPDKWHIMDFTSPFSLLVLISVFIFLRFLNYKQQDLLMYLRTKIAQDSTT